MKKLFEILFVLLLCIFVFSATYIIGYLYNSHKAERNFSNLLDELESSPEPHNEKTKSKEYFKIKEHRKKYSPTVLPKYKKLYNENKDMIGWLKINNTPINYPVMQTKKKPLYYLHKDWYKDDSTHGVPFIDARCSLDSNNIIIYAHNMKDGSMFGSLKKYRNKNYYLKHSIIEFDSLYAKRKYKIIGVLYSKIFYNSTPSKNSFLFYNYPELNSKKKFNYYLKEVKKHSLFSIKDTAKYGDTLITLSTCSYHTENGRFLVVAKKII